jgi:hypothetical protein
MKLLPLQGALLIAFIPRALPWAKSFCPYRACCLKGALPFQGVLIIGVADLYISFDKRFSEISLSPTRPERAEAHSPGQRPGLFWAVTCRPVRAKALKLLATYKAVALTGRIAHCHYTQGAALG